jgi:hypothetical protein
MEFIRETVCAMQGLDREARRPFAGLEVRAGLMLSVLRTTAFAVALGLVSDKHAGAGVVVLAADNSDRLWMVVA